ncbi:hypothetical protein [Nocardia tengchongensis]
MSETLDAVVKDGVDTKKLAQQLLAQAKAEGIDLVGPGGLLNQLAKTVLETALESETPLKRRWGRYRLCGTGPNGNGPCNHTIGGAKGNRTPDLLGTAEGDYRDQSRTVNDKQKLCSELERCQLLAIFDNRTQVRSQLAFG